MKRFLSVLLSILLVFMTLPVLVSAGSTPSEWAVREVGLANETGLVTDATTKDYSAPVTREQFCELVVKLYEKLTGDTASDQGNVFTDTNKNFDGGKRPQGVYNR